MNTITWPKNFSSIHFFRFCSHENALLWSIDVSNNTPRYANSTIVKIPKAKLIIFTHIKAVVFAWLFDVQERVVASRLHLLAATQASKISANTFRKRYSTKVNTPIDKRTAASWKLRPCRDDEIKYVMRMALNWPSGFKLWKMSEVKKKL